MGLCKILMTCDYYSPGWKAGGLIRSISSLVECLGDEFSFRIVTRDRDIGDASYYPGHARDNSWQKVGKAEVLYLPPKRQTLINWFKLLRITSYDLLYLNSFLSPNFTIKALLLRRCRLIPRVPVLLAARGNLSPDALSLKAYKKRPFMIIAKCLELYKQIQWQASSGNEKAQIMHNMQRGEGKDVIPFYIVPDLNLSWKNFTYEHKAKEKGFLRIVFLSRICRMKNLGKAFEILKGIRGHVCFDVYGPQEDERYWQQCQQIIQSLPKEISVNHFGGVPPEDVISILSQYDLFFLPTLGENYGHVILEALLAGCPVLISDQTPWRGLEEKGIGWDVSLDQLSRYREIIQQCLEMSAEEHRIWSIRASKFGKAELEEGTGKSIELHREMFRRVVSISK